MGYTLSNLLIDVYGQLGQLQTAEAEGGSTTSVIDSALTGGRDDDWNGGAVFILSAGGAPPESEYSRIKDYTDQSGTLTLAHALSAPVETGDIYGLVSAYYPLQDMIALANLALRGLGAIPQVDTSLSTTSGICEYPASAAWKRKLPMRVEITARPDSGTPTWTPLYDWEFVPAAAGENGKLILGRPPQAGQTLRVWYAAAHPILAQHDDLLYEGIAPALAAAALTELALRWQVSRLEGANDFLVQLWRQARQALAEAKRQHPIWQPARRGRAKLAGIGRRTWR